MAIRSIFVLGILLNFSSIARASCSQYLVSKSGISIDQLAEPDLKIWSGYLAFVRIFGEEADFGLEILPDQVRKLSSETAKAIAQDATKNYFELSTQEAPSSGISERWALDLSPRRIADAIALAYLDPAAAIGKDLKDGFSCHESYQRFLEQSQRLFGVTTSYDVHDVLKVLRALQNWHRVMPADTEIKSKPDSFYRGRKELVVYGSFPLGKARIDRSDIDINRIGSTQYYRDDRAGDFFTSLNSLEDELNAHFAQSGRNANINASVVHFGLDKRHLNLSPIIFRIEDNDIVMEVYSTRRSRPEDFVPLARCGF